MEFGNENVRVKMEGDRISSLPDEIIHRILSFNDTKYAVQTSVLSTRWKLVWTTLPYLKFSNDLFPHHARFSKFVNRVLSDRDNRTEVSTLDLHLRGSANQKFIQKIGDYAMAHNVQKLNIVAFKFKGKKDDQNFPLCFFSLQSLKHLSVKAESFNIYPLPQLPLDLPALTSIELYNVGLCAASTMSLDLFSKCVSLRNLTLSYCRSSGFRGRDTLLLSSGSFNCLEEVNLHVSSSYFLSNKRNHEELNMFYKLLNARYVTLGGSLIKLRYKVLDVLEYHPSPFRNLKYLRIEGVEMQKNRAKFLTRKVTTYLWNSLLIASISISEEKLGVTCVVHRRY